MARSYLEWVECIGRPQRPELHLVRSDGMDQIGHAPMCPLILASLGPMRSNLYPSKNSASVSSHWTPLARILYIYIYKFNRVVVYRLEEFRLVIRRVQILIPGIRGRDRRKCAPFVSTQSFSFVTGSRWPAAFKNISNRQIWTSVSKQLRKRLVHADTNIRLTTSNIR